MDIITDKFNEFVLEFMCPLQHFHTFFDKLIVLLVYVYNYNVASLLSKSSIKYSGNFKCSRKNAIYFRISVCRIVEFLYPTEYTNFIMVDRSFHYPWEIEAHTI